MTKAKLIIEQPGGDPVEIDLDVTKGNPPVAIIVSDHDVRVHTSTEPKVEVV